MIEALEKLRGLRGNGRMYEDVVCEAARLADEIQAEVDSKYLLLPVDADGVPIKVGDVLKNSSGTTRVVSNVGLGGHDNTFSAWDFIAGDYHLHGGGYWHHVKPHESASEGDTAPVSVSDECEPAESESAAPTDVDSRERLELDIRGSLGFTTKDVFGWLDRQAAITERECKRLNWEYCETCEAGTECDRLRESGYRLSSKVCELTDYLTDIACRLGIEGSADIPSDEEIYDEISRRIDGMQGHVCELEKTARRVNEADSQREYMRHDLETMTADRDYWRDLYMQSHAENAPETPDFAENPQKTPERVCRTCRFSAETDPERKTLTHTCYRFPSEMLKAPDDWCGEWSA